MKNVVNSNAADAQEPHYYDRCEQESYTVGPVMLEAKQEHQYDASNRDFNIWNN